MKTFLIQQYGNGFTLTVSDKHSERAGVAKTAQELYDLLADYIPLPAAEPEPSPECGAAFGEPSGKAAGPKKWFIGNESLGDRCFVSPPTESPLEAAARRLREAARRIDEIRAAEKEVHNEAMRLRDEGDKACIEHRDAKEACYAAACANHR